MSSLSEYPTPIPIEKKERINIHEILVIFGQVLLETESRKFISPPLEIYSDHHWSFHAPNFPLTRVRGKLIE